MSTQHGSWDEHSFETSVFKYTYKQFISLRTAALATSSISLASSALIMTVYIYMLVYHRKQANRVSLRCVFLCCLSDTLNAIMNILITSQKGDTTFCRAAGVVIEFSNIMSASSLTLVGLNLVLIFVINVNRRDLLEKFYYPAAIIYALVGITVPIYGQVTADASTYNRFSCWYLLYIEDRTYNIFSWMWFYAFIFLVNIIAIICSVSAMIKLLHEQNILAAKMSNIAAASSFTSKKTDKQLDKSVKKRNNNVFTKVVLRCIIYPLVPFLANIFGFILQLVITTSNHTPGFSLAMLEIIFSCIEGFFVAVVFFTDPAITSFMKQAYQGWHQKYIEEYTLVAKEDVNKHTNNSIESTPNNTAPLSPSPSFNTSLTPLDLNSLQHHHYVQSPSSAIFNQSDRYHDVNIYQHFQLPSIHNYREKEEKKERDILSAHHHHDHQQPHKKQIIPMRRLQVMAPNLSSSNKHHRHASLTSSISTIAPLPAITRNNHHQQLVISTSNVKEIYVPYRFPRLAKFVHFILKCFGAKKNSSPTIKKPKDNNNTNTKQDSNETLYPSDDDIPSNSQGSSTVFVITPTKQDVSEEPDYYSDHRRKNSSIVSTQHYF